MKRGRVSSAGTGQKTPGGSRVVAPRRPAARPDLRDTLRPQAPRRSPGAPGPRAAVTPLGLHRALQTGQPLKPEARGTRCERAGHTPGEAPKPKLCKQQDCLFLWRLRTPPRVLLRGQMLHDTGRDLLIFLGNPQVDGLDQLSRWGLSIADFPLHSCAADAIVVAPIEDGALAVAQEMADRAHLASQKTAQQQARFKSLVMGSVDIIAVVSEQLVLSYWTPSLELLLDVDPEQLHGTSLFDWVSEQDHEPVREAIAGLSEPDTVAEMGFQLRLGDDRRTIQCAFRRTFTDSGEPGFVMNARDVTDQLEMQRRLARAGRLESIGRVAANVAHDFNNILCAITSGAGLARLDIETGEATHEELDQYMREILEAAERASSLTRQLLTFSRHTTVRNEIVCVGALIEGLRPMLTQLLPRSIELDVQIEAPTAHVRIARSQLEQVVTNLVVNARDAIEGEGRIAVTVRQIRVGEQLASTMPELSPGQHVWIEAADGGCGMDSETLDRAFDPFFTTKGFGEGTGLGLATVHGIVRQAQGHVHVYSEVGVGTTVKVVLPHVVGKEEAVEAPLEPAADGTETVLLCEDDELILRLARTVLIRSGYDVIAVRGPREAIELLEGGRRPDLLVTDVVMPEMNGAQLSAAMREIHPSTPTLFITGYASTILAAEDLEPGDDILHKPFGPTDLTRSVRKVLDRTAGEPD